MGDKPPERLERREYTRYEMVIPIVMEVAMKGSSPTTGHGTTIIMSRGGMLADLGIAPRPAARCRVTFMHAGDRVFPNKAVGKIIHVNSLKHGRHVVAVVFDKPLETVKPPGGLY